MPVILPADLSGQLLPLPYRNLGAESTGEVGCRRNCLAWPSEKINGEITSSSTEWKHTSHKGDGFFSRHLIWSAGQIHAQPPRRMFCWGQCDWSIDRSISSVYNTCQFKIVGIGSYLLLGIGPDLLTRAECMQQFYRSSYKYGRICKIELKFSALTL